MQVQKRFKEFNSFLDIKFLFDLFIKHVRDHMKGIKMKLIKEMKMLKVLQSRITRRYSYDDYFIIDTHMQRSFLLNSSRGMYSQEDFLSTAIHNLTNDKYEAFRKLNRYKLWKEIKANMYKVQHFSRAPEQFKRIFELIYRFYERIKNSILSIEEAWSFLVEMIYSRNMEGQLLFENYHKQLFN